MGTDYSKEYCDEEICTKEEFLGVYTEEQILEAFRSGNSRRRKAAYIHMSHYSNFNKFSHNRDLILEAAKYNGLIIGSCGRLEYVDDEYIVLAAIENKPHALQFASKRIRHTRHIAISAIRKSGTALKYVGDVLQNDPILVSLAINEDGTSLRYASLELRHDKEIVLTATLKDKTALRFAGVGLKSDIGFMSLAKKDPAFALEMLRDGQKF